MGTPVLKTPRLILRPLTLEDAPRIQNLFPHFNIVRYMRSTVPWPYPKDGARRFLEDSALPGMQKGKEHSWAITFSCDPEQRLIGIVSLHPSQEDHRGFWMGEAYHGQGLMKEATVPVTDFAFDELGMPALVLFNAEPNRPSHRIKELSGAVITGTQDNVPYVAGSFRRIRWRLEPGPWRASRKLLARG